MPFTTEQKIAELEREIKMRRQVYPNQVANRKMSQQTADDRIAILESVIVQLRSLKKIQDGLREFADRMMEMGKSGDQLTITGTDLLIHQQKLKP